VSSTINQDGTIPEATAGGTFGGVGITSSTNASPIVVQTTAPHGAQDGDTVRVEGHQGNTAANGLWLASVVDSTHVALLTSTGTSTGSGVGTATGQFYDYAINPLLTIPSDGDLANGASVKPAFAGCFNAVPFLYERAGKYQLRQNYIVNTSGTFVSAWATQVVPKTSTWTVITGTTGLLNSGLLGYAPVWKGETDFFDYIDILFSTTEANDCATAGDIGLGLGISLNGGAYSLLPGSTQAVIVDSVPVGVHLAGYAVATGATAAQGQTFDLCIMGYCASGAATAATVQLMGDWTLNVRHYRPNG